MNIHTTNASLQLEAIIFRETIRIPHKTPIQILQRWGSYDTVNGVASGDIEDLNGNGVTASPKTYQLI